MGIQRFTDPVPPTRPMRIVSYPPVIYVRMLGNPDDCLKVWLHMNGKHSRPCLGEECIDCREDRFPYGYAPVQVGRYSGKAFYGESLGILPVTTFGLNVCLKDLKGKVLEVTRKPCTKRGQTAAKIVDLAQAVAELPECFDVLPHMQRLWAWFEKQDTPPGDHVLRYEATRLDLLPRGKEQAS